MIRRALVLLGGAASAWTAITLLTGGFTARIAGFSISSHDPVKPLMVAVLAWIGAALAAGRPSLRDHAAACVPRIAAQSLVRLLARLPMLVVGTAVLLTLATSLAWGVFSIGGADSYGYVSQAVLWTRGVPQVDQPLVRTFPWPFANWSFTPLGYIPTGPFAVTIVPTYPAGYPLAMALFCLTAGPNAVFAVVPLAAMSTVWLTWRLGRRLAGPWCGSLAAVLAATSPTFLFQAIRPMSDVPATAWWTAALLLACGPRWPSALAAGAAAAMALVTRPNLVLLLAPFGLYFGGRAWRRGEYGRLAAFVAGVLPGPALVAALHARWYGSPWKSGYGTLDEIYAWSYLPTNLPHYARTFAAIEQPLMACGLVALMVLTVRPRATKRRCEASHPQPAAAQLFLLAGVIAAVWLSYVFYVPYPEWWYLRFFLPSYPAVCCLAAIGATARVRHGPTPGRAAFIVAVILLSGGWGYVSARTLGIPSDKQAEQRYRAVGLFIARHLPPTAVLISHQHSGSIRYYADRLTLRYDWLERRWLDQAITALTERGYRPYLVIDDSEREAFRQRFRGFSPLSALDWPPAAEWRRSGVVRIYDPAHREAFLGGARLRPIMIEPP